jgi:arylformamidase
VNLGVDLSKPISLALELDFSAQQPRHFGAPPATSKPFAVPGFSGSVEQGASCNCQVLTLIPHCNGTHTECVGHLTRERADAYKTVPFGLIHALLISVTPVEASTTNETTEPAPQSGDLLITRAALEQHWPKATLAARALIIRTRHNYTNPTNPFLTRDAATLLVERYIEHLLTDLPSIDRGQDEGRLTAHRVFFGLPRGSTTLAEAKRPNATITELAHIPDTVTDGAYQLQFQVPAIAGDAVPSRPLLYPLNPT